MIRAIVLTMLSLALLTSSAAARTIILTDEDCERMAAICADAPRLSWAGYEAYTGNFNGIYVDLVSNRGFLIRYPIERIPKGQRVTNAEWVIPSTYQAAGEQRLFIRRMIAEWGPGVCHQYRMTRPKKVEWALPGGRGASSDRAAKPTAVVRINGAGEHVVNVTEDVELWYTGAVPNHGWMLNVDDDHAFLRLSSPAWTVRGNWKLRITYEPE